MAKGDYNCDCRMCIAQQLRRVREEENAVYAANRAVIAEFDRITIARGLREFGTYVTLTALWQRAQFGMVAVDADGPTATYQTNIDRLLAEKRKKYGEHRGAWVDGREFVIQSQAPFPGGNAFYYPTIIEDTAEAIATMHINHSAAKAALARPGAQAKPKPMHSLYCLAEGCSGVIDGYTDVINDEQGATLRYETERCECWCHDEPTRTQGRTR